MTRFNDVRNWAEDRNLVVGSNPQDARKAMGMALDALSRNLIFMETPVERRTVQPWTQTVDSITALRNELNTAPKEMK